MLEIVRRFGLGQRDEPLIPGMQVVDWRVLKAKSGKEFSVLAHKDSMLYVAAYLVPKSSPRTNKQADTSSLTEPKIMEPLQAIDVVNIFPEYTSQFALYCKSGNTQREAYVKRTKILDLFTASGMSVLKTPHASQITAHEASICARLSFHEHSNIAEFLGVQISNVLEFDYHGAPIHVSLPGKYITGLVFTKYDCTLHDLVIRRQKFDTRLCLQSIWGGIQYLHYVGVVHGDIRPHKIFVKRGKNKDHFVIGDFDCAHDLGSVVTFKAGDPRWTKRKTIGKDIAKKSDDWSGFVMLKEWLVKEVGGKLADYEDIGKNRRAVQG